MGVYWHCSNIVASPNAWRGFIYHWPAIWDKQILLKGEAHIEKGPWESTANLLRLSPLNNQTLEPSAFLGRASTDGRHHVVLFFGVVSFLLHNTSVNRSREITQQHFIGEKITKADIKAPKKLSGGMSIANRSSRTGEPRKKVCPGIGRRGCEPRQWRKQNMWASVVRMGIGCYSGVAYEVLYIQIWLKNFLGKIGEVRGGEVCLGFSSYMGLIWWRNYPRLLRGPWLGESNMVIRIFFRRKTNNGWSVIPMPW